MPPTQENRRTLFIHKSTQKGRPGVSANSERSTAENQKPHSVSHQHRREEDGKRTRLELKTVEQDLEDERREDSRATASNELAGAFDGVVASFAEVAIASPVHNDYELELFELTIRHSSSRQES